MHRNPLFTIGYEGAGMESFLAALRQAGVRVLVDVRAVAASRRAGFAKRALAANLETAGIRYEHLRDLGTPAAGRQAARRGNVAEMRRIYARHMETPEAQTALAQAIAIAAEAPACLLCLERDHTACHRAIVAQAMSEQTGFDIVPLVA